MDTAGGLRGGVAADAPGEGELLEEALHPGQVFALIRVDFRIGPLQISLGQDGRRAVTRAGNIDGVEVIFVDQPVKVDIGEALAGVRAPVAQQSGFGMLQGQGFPEQGVVPEVKHAQAQIEAGAPVGVDFPQLLGAQGGLLDGGASLSVGAEGWVIGNCCRLLGGRCHKCSPLSSLGLLCRDSFYLPGALRAFHLFKAAVPPPNYFNFPIRDIHNFKL